MDYNIYIHDLTASGGGETSHTSSKRARKAETEPEKEDADTPNGFLLDKTVKKVSSAIPHLLCAAGAVAAAKSAVGVIEMCQTTMGGEYALSNVTANANIVASMAVNPIGAAYGFASYEMAVAVENGRQALRRELFGDADISGYSKGV